MTARPPLQGAKSQGAGVRDGVHEEDWRQHGAGRAGEEGPVRRRPETERLHTVLLPKDRDTDQRRPVERGSCPGEAAPGCGQSGSEEGAC